MPATAHRGQAAERPTAIPRRGWKDILLRVKEETTNDHVSVVAAGVAFFGLLAIFPAVTALISIAGYLLEPADIGSQLESLAAMLPQDAASIIQDQVVQVTGGSETATGLAAIIGLAIALYGATKGMMTLMEGMNIAYDEEEKRGFFALYLTGFALTLFLILGVLVTFGLMIALPAAVTFLNLPESVSTAVNWLKWPLLAVLTVLGLAVVYRFGPSRANPKWRWVSAGAVVAMVLWLLGTLAFTVYVRNFGSYNETYGTLGGVIVLLTWLWLSAFVVLLGAELNSEAEHQTSRDSTTGPARPMGQRGAVKADTMAAGLADEEDGGGPRVAGRGRGTGRAGEEDRPGMLTLIALIAARSLLSSPRRR